MNAGVIDDTNDQFCSKQICLWEAEKKAEWTYGDYVIVRMNSYTFRLQFSVLYSIFNQLLHEKAIEDHHILKTWTSNYHTTTLFRGQVITKFLTECAAIQMCTFIFPDVKSFMYTLMICCKKTTDIFLLCRPEFMFSVFLTLLLIFTLSFNRWLLVNLYHWYPVHYHSLLHTQFSCESH